MRKKDALMVFILNQRKPSWFERRGSFFSDVLVFVNRNKSKKWRRATRGLKWKLDRGQFEISETVQFGDYLRHLAKKRLEPNDTVRSLVCEEWNATISKKKNVTFVFSCSYVKWVKLICINKLKWCEVETILKYTSNLDIRLQNEKAWLVKQRLSFSNFLHLLAFHKFKIIVITL